MSLMPFQRQIVCCPLILNWQAKCESEILNIKVSTFIHELDSCFEVMEENRFINLFLRKRPDFDDALGDNTKITFVSKNKLM
jgi:hypothetical protein